MPAAVSWALSLRHTKAHMTRAMLEGVSYGLNDSLEPNAIDGYLA